MNLNLTTATRYGLNVLAALGLSIALYLGRSIFIPLTIAGLVAAIMGVSFPPVPATMQAVATADGCTAAPTEQRDGTQRLSCSHSRPRPPTGPGLMMLFGKCFHGGGWWMLDTGC